MNKFYTILSLFFACFIVSCNENESKEEVKLIETTFSLGTGPVISFDKVKHNFDTISYVDGGQCVFHYTNTGDQPLVISTILTNCGCVTTQWSQEPLLPGGNDSIILNISSRGVGNIMRAVVVKSNAINEPAVTLRMSGYFGEKDKSKL